MSDTAPLRRRLLRALDLAPLALAGAASLSCSASDAAEEEARELERAKRREQSARDAEQASKRVREADEAAAAAAIEQQRLDEAAKQKAEADAAKLAADKPPGPFGCATGEWCGSKAIAERFAGNPMPDKPAALACPGNLAPHGATETDPNADPEHDPPTAMGYAFLDTAATQAKRDAGEADLCCYDWGSLCGGGRPLLDSTGQAHFAALERVEAEPSCDEFATLDPRIAAGWLDDARMEHASIASFLRAEAELAALDAPAALREACSRAADDERRHAHDCFTIAARYGQSWRAPALPSASQRPASLDRLALDTLLEGGIGETIAALMASRAARSAHAALASVLERIASDELEHAALAWQTLAWAVEVGGDSVRAVLEQAASRARPRSFELPAPDLNADELAIHGRLDARAKVRAIHDAWCELIDPVLAELLGLHSPSSVQRSLPSIATN